MTPVEWTYIYLHGAAFGLVCLVLLAAPYAAGLRPGEGIRGWWFWFAGLLACCGYGLGWWLLV